MARHNQALRANLRTLLPSTLEQIGGRPRIYYQVSDIQLTLDFHQVQYVYICNLPYIKWLVFRGHGNENHIIPDTRNR